MKKSKKQNQAVNTPKLYMLAGITFLALGLFLFASVIVHSKTIQLSPGEEPDQVPPVVSSLSIALGTLFISKSKKRGQSAIDLITSYGWSLLAFIAALSTLSFVGVFSPQDLFGDKFVLQPPLVAVSLEATEMPTNQIKIEIANAAGEEIEIREFEVIPSSPPSASCTKSLPNLIVNKGSSAVISIDCTGLTQGDRVKAEVNIWHARTDTTFSRVSTGSLIVKVK